MWGGAAPASSCLHLSFYTQEYVRISAHTGFQFIQETHFDGAFQDVKYMHPHPSWSGIGVLFVCFSGHLPSFFRFSVFFIFISNPCFLAFVFFCSRLIASGFWCLVYVVPVVYEYYLVRCHGIALFYSLYCIVPVFFLTTAELASIFNRIEEAARTRRVPDVGG